MCYPVLQNLIRVTADIVSLLSAMDKKKKILLRGLYNRHNFGDDLLLIANLEFLSKQLGFTDKNLETYTLRYNESISELGYKSPLKLKFSIELSELDKHINKRLRKIRIPWKIPSIDFLIRKISREGGSKRLKIYNISRFLCFCTALIVDAITYRILHKALFFQRYLNFLENLDLIHYIGGGYFTDRWRYILIYEFITIFLAKIVNPNLKVIGTGLGVGPLNNPINRIIFKIFANNFTSIFVREDESLELLDSLKATTYKKVLGDDAILLLPYFHNVKSKNRLDCANIAALNLKNFNEYQYSLIKEPINNYLKLQKDKKYELCYFCFGRKPGPDDRSLIEFIDERYKSDLVICDPYEQGWTIFLECLAKADISLGFAYHFNIILTLLMNPTIGVYSGEYYRQKIEGGIKLLNAEGIVLSIDDLNKKNLGEVVDATTNNLNQVNVETRLKSIYKEMKKEYLNAYENILKSS